MQKYKNKQIKRKIKTKRFIYHKELVYINKQKHLLVQNKMYDHLELIKAHIYLNNFYPIQINYRQHVLTYSDHIKFSKLDAYIENQLEVHVVLGLYCVLLYE